MSDILLSIIIPVYNVENYIERCLNSINYQDERLEVIIVNDGSKDNSEKIILEFLKKNHNFKYLKKENGGVSSARNFGIENAKGKFISFLDADDYLTTDYLSVIFPYLNQNLNMLCFNYDIVFDDHEYTFSDLKNDVIQLTENSWVDDYLFGSLKTKINAISCNKIYVRDILIKKDIKFSIGQTIGEDFLFNIKYLQSIKEIKTIDNSLYKYYQRSESVMNKYNKNYIYNIMNYENVILDFSLKENTTISDFKFTKFYLEILFGVLLQESKCDNFSNGLRNINIYISEKLNFQKLIKIKKLGLKLGIYKLLCLTGLYRLVYLVLFYTKAFK